MAGRTPARALVASVVLAGLGIAGCASGTGTGSRTTGPTGAPPPSTTAAPATTVPPPTTTTTAPGATTPQGTLLAPGSSGPAVLVLQQRLAALGYWLGTPDGTYGSLTAQAVVALQKVAGLARDGEVGPATAAALARGVRPVPRSTTGHVVEVDLTHQVLLLVTGGRLDAALDTSTGSGATYVEQGQTSVAVTPPGHFTITRQVDGQDVSPLGVLWRPKYFNGGIAVHGYASVPPYPASHGCVRVSTAAIDWIWAADLAPIGTPVWVY